MKPVASSETKPWWYVSALEGVRKQTDENSEALQRMDGTIHSLQKKIKEAVCIMNERCLSLESSCGELSTKLDACMTSRGELKTISGQLQSVKQARESESNIMDRIAALECSYQQDKANIDDFRARISYEVKQEVGELREALELESATLSAALRNLVLDVDFAAQKMTELRQGTGIEIASPGPNTASASDKKHNVAFGIAEEPNLQSPAEIIAVQKELAQALESHLRCLRGVVAQSSAATQEAPASLVDEVSAGVASKNNKLLQAQTNQIEERILAKLGIHSAATDWTELASGHLKDEHGAPVSSRKQHQARGQPSAGGSPVATAAGLVDLGADEELRTPRQRNLPAARELAKAAVVAAAATVTRPRRQTTPKRVSVTSSRGNNGRVSPLQLSQAEAVPVRGLSQPIQASRRAGQQRLCLKSKRPLSVATPVLSSMLVPAGTQ